MISNTITCDRCGKSEPTVTETKGETISGMHVRVLQHGQDRSSAVHSKDLCADCFVIVQEAIADVMAWPNRQECAAHGFTPAVIVNGTHRVAPDAVHAILDAGKAKHEADVQFVKTVNRQFGFTVVVPDSERCVSGCAAMGGERTLPCGCHTNEHPPGRCDRTRVMPTFNACNGCGHALQCAHNGACARGVAR